MRESLRLRGVSISAGVGALAMLCSAVAPVALGAAETALVPHRAVYGLSLSKDSVPQGGGVASAHGKMEYEWSDVCDGWATRQRALVVVTHADGSRIDFGWSMTTWESKDGLRYRFQLRTLPPGGEEVVNQGEASLDGPGMGGTAVFSSPEEKTVQLPKGTIFPSQHSMSLIDAIKSADMPLWRTVFDGSGTKDGLSGTNVALAGEIPKGAGSALDDALLDEQESWRVVVAFFGLDRDAIEPDTEQRFRYYSNGIVDDIVIDFKDFAVAAEMVDLEALPDPGC